MDGHRRDGVVVVGGNARQQLYDARGYGDPIDSGDIALSAVEAAHLLFRGDLSSVDGQDFMEFVQAESSELINQFLVYAELRERGFYVSPQRDTTDRSRHEPDFIVHPRGTGPWDGEIAYRVLVSGEQTSIESGVLGDVVLAVVDDEGEVTYFGTGTPSPEGTVSYTPSDFTGCLFTDHVVSWDAPDEVYRKGFYGQPLAGRELSLDEGLQLSLVEAAYLASNDHLSLTDTADVSEVIHTRGRAAISDQFDRRLTVYSELRSRGIVPKTGFKFGADFRTYNAIESIEDLGHSDALVRVLSSPYEFTPRELALDVRLAGGVRKRLLYALVSETNEDTRWLSVSRLTP